MKPVYYADEPILARESKTNQRRGLCTGPTFTAGTACFYSCRFCYVSKMQGTQPGVIPIVAGSGKPFEGIIIRRQEAVKRLGEELDRLPTQFRQSRQTILASPLVDVAPNVEMAYETADCCMQIFRKTNWDVRLLSKSNLLPLVAKRLPLEFRQRVIFGVSTGTLDDNLAKVLELGTPLVSKRLDSLYWLQDHGFRTFGMLCPIFPQVDYNAYARRAKQLLREDACETVWAEPINARGGKQDFATENMIRCVSQLATHQFNAEAELLFKVAKHFSSCEKYIKDLFEALANEFSLGKLKFLHYPIASTLKYWLPQQARGAVLLGKYAPEPADEKPDGTQLELLPC